MTQAGSNVFYCLRGRKSCLEVLVIEKIVTKQTAKTTSDGATNIIEWLFYARKLIFKCIKFIFRWTDTEEVKDSDVSEVPNTSKLSEAIMLK